MESLFSIDGWLGKLGNYIFKALGIGLLWLIGSAFIMTVGASTTAAYYTCLKYADGENSGMVQTFWKSYKENFWQSIPLSLIWCALVVSLVYFYSHRTSFNQFGTGVTSLYMIISLIVFCVFLNVFPILSKFNLKTFQLIKMSIVFCYVGVVTVVKTLLLLIISGVISIMIPGYICMAVGVFFLVTATFYHKVFSRLLEDSCDDPEKVEF